MCGLTSIQLHRPGALAQGLYSMRQDLYGMESKYRGFAQI